MRIILVFYFIFLTQALINAQSISTGLYVNEESNEFIYFYNDTLQFRLCNKDALGTFSIGKGKYDVHNRGKYHIKACKSILEQTSIIDRFPRNDSLIVIKVLYNDSMPIMSAYVYINDAKAKKNGSIGVSISDKNGQVTLSENQVDNYTNKELIIQIEALGFSTKKMVVLERGYNYVIQSIMPETYPFTVFRTGKILINSLNAQEIEVEIWRSARERKRSGKTKLSNVDADFHCSHFLFDKDIVNFYRK
ncbi:MAG: hypothetical protein C0397_18350 [Odoribacter sp.]|nr:hypothetical protein [Odoribacter sp.]